MCITKSSIAPLSDAVLKNLTTLNTNFGEVYNYYDGENYKDDDYAQGFTLHKSMTEIGKATAESIIAMGDALSLVEDKLAAAELKVFEGDKKHGYWFRYYNVEAKKAVRAVESGDAAKIASSLAAVEATQKGLTEFSAGVKEGPSPQVYSVYVDFGNNFNNALKKLNREISGKNDSKIEQLSSGVIIAYNNLVSTGNTMYGLEENGLLR